jgi:hypothetical protein
VHFIVDRGYVTVTGCPRYSVRYWVCFLCTSFDVESIQSYVGTNNERVASKLLSEYFM